jgi:ribonuclease Z
MRRIFPVIAVIVSLLALTAGGYGLFKRQIAERLFERAVADTVGRDQTEDLVDGIHVYVCGSGSPMPDQGRAGPCLGVLAGKRAFIFDVGSGSMRKLSRMGFPIGRLERVFLTHLHSDHFDGMGELLLQAWIGGTRTHPLMISGPVGTKSVVDGFNAAYAIDSGYRVAHHGPAVAPPSGYGGIAQEFSTETGTETRILIDDSDLKITAFSVNHAPVAPAFGYRINYKGRSVVISGDTAFSQNLVASSKGVDVLFHEALQPKMTQAMAQAAEQRGQVNLAKVLRDIRGYHTTPEDAAKAAQQSGARELVIYHLVPPLPSRLIYPMFLGDAAKNFSGPIRIAEDGLLVSLPTGSNTVQHHQTFSSMIR